MAPASMMRTRFRDQVEAIRQADAGQPGSSGRVDGQDDIGRSRACTTYPQKYALLVCAPGDPTWIS